MKTELSKILDNCIERIRNGEAIETCLAENERLKEQLEPLLRTACRVTALPRVSPSEEFRKTSKARLMEVLRQEQLQKNAASATRKTAIFEELAEAWTRLSHDIAGAKRVAIPVALSLIVLVVASFSAVKIMSPSPALAAECTLNILSGNAEVMKSGSESWGQGSDGMSLKSGARIRTSANSYALLTFFDGSTTKLEADSDVEIKQIEYTDGQSVSIVIQQWLGTTWSQVNKIAGYTTNYRIDTPSASAVAYGTLFATKVGENGFTRVITAEGLVNVSAQGEQVDLPPNYQTEVEPGTKPAKPVTAPASEDSIIITIEAPAVGSIKDPTGSSTGYLPDGFAYNQITGSWSSSPAEGKQVITIPQPVNGEYSLALRFLSAGQAPVSIVCLSGDKQVFTFYRTYGVEQENGWLLRLNVDVENGKITGGEVGGVEPLTKKAPEKIVVTKLAKEKIVPIVPSTGGQEQAKDKAPEQSKDKPQSIDTSVDKGQSGDKGKAQDTSTSVDKGQPEDKGKAQDTSTSIDKGQSEDKGKAQDTSTSIDKGQSEDKGKAQDTSTSIDKGQSEDKGKTQDTGTISDKGQSGDSGKSQDSGTSSDKGQSGDSGKSQDSGTSSDKGQSGDSGKSQDTSTGSDKGQSGDSGKAQDTGTGSDKGQSGDSGKSQDSGAGSDKGQSGDSGKSQDTSTGTDKGQSGDSGKSQDSGTSSDKGQSGDSGKSQDSGTGSDKGQSGDSGKSQDTGTGSDKGQSGDSGKSQNTGNDKGQSEDKGKK